MLRSAAVSLIQRRLGYRSDKADEILSELQIAQDFLEEGVEVIGPQRNIFTIVPWFLLSEIMTATTTATVERVAVPAGFIREHDPDALWYFDSTLAATDANKWVELWKGDLDVLRDEFLGTGPPKAYTLDGGYFRIFPTPDAAYSLKMLLYMKDTVLSAATDTENKWLKNAPQLLIGEAGGKLAMSLRDMKAEAHFVSLRVSAAWKLHVANEERMYTNRRYEMGGED